MARNSVLTIALASALALTGLAPAAFAAEQSPIGSVEGFGGFAGRVGNAVEAPAVKQLPATVASVEGFGGFAGRVGAPIVATDVGVAQNLR